MELASGNGDPHRKEIAQSIFSVKERTCPSLNRQLRELLGCRQLYFY